MGHGKSGGREHQFPQGFAGVVADAIQYSKWARPGHSFPFLLPCLAIRSIFSSTASRRSRGRVHETTCVIPTVQLEDAQVANYIPRRLSREAPTGKVFWPFELIRTQQGEGVPLFIAGGSLGGLVNAHMMLEEPKLFAGRVWQILLATSSTRVLNLVS